MELSLSESARRYLEEQVAVGRYRTPAEVVEDLVSRQRTQEDAERREAERRHDALLALLDEMKTMPLEGSDDGFSNRDHDRLLYGPS
jgi:Arc/MetJ-type ribon-helix-helix transcriptional regulator